MYYFAGIYRLGSKMIVAYLLVAAVVAVAAFVVGECRVADRPAPCAVIAGLLWPVLLVGLAQFLLIAAVTRLARPTRSGANLHHDALPGARP